MFTLIALLAIVTQDQAQLRAAPKDSAQQQAVLWQGDSLEVRGEKLDYLQVYDHRRERAGYIKASQVRMTSILPEDAPESLAVVRFLRDTPGAEALGLSYSAVYLKAAPANTITPEIFDAIGGMAERLARRASTRQTKQNDEIIAAHLEVVTQYGINIKGYKREGRMQLCYDGESFRRVLAMPASNEQKARAALALTRQECIDPNMRPTERMSLDAWRADLLDKVELIGLPEYTKNRLHMRRANVWSSIAFERKRKGDTNGSNDAGNRALLELASVNKTEMSDSDQISYADAGVRVGAARWSAEPEQVGTNNPAKLSVVTTPGQPGETCVNLVDAKHPVQKPLALRCTYSIVWPASARSNAQNTALTLAVQPMDTWRELWVFHQSAGNWIIDVLPPANNDPELGYAEFSGWIPATNKILVTREAKVDGRFKRSFEVFNLDSLQVENGADKPESLSLFHRWQDPMWKRVTVSLR